MAYKIKFTYADKDYCLEMTRESVKSLERMGFDRYEIASKPMTMIPLLFFGAFAAHHPSIKKEKTDEIYETVANKTAMIKALCEMFDETRDTLIEDKEASEGNLKWEASR